MKNIEKQNNQNEEQIQTQNGNEFVNIKAQNKEVNRKKNTQKNKKRTSIKIDYDDFQMLENDFKTCSPTEIFNHLLNFYKKNKVIELDIEKQKQFKKLNFISTLYEPIFRKNNATVQITKVKVNKQIYDKALNVTQLKNNNQLINISLEYMIYDDYFAWRNSEFQKFKKDFSFLVMKFKEIIKFSQMLQNFSLLSMEEALQDRGVEMKTDEIYDLIHFIDYNAKPILNLLNKVEDYKKLLEGK